MVAEIDDEIVEDGLRDENEMCQVQGPTHQVGWLYSKEAENRSTRVEQPEQEVVLRCYFQFTRNGA